MLELFMINFITIFFSISAFIMAILCPFTKINWNIQIIIFVALSLSLIFLLRNIFSKTFYGNTSTSNQNEFAGKIAIVTEKISPQEPGRIEFRGSPWQAISSEILKVGTKVIIIKNDNITLYVSSTSKDLKNN